MVRVVVDVLRMEVAMLLVSAKACGAKTVDSTSAIGVSVTPVSRMGGQAMALWARRDARLLHHRQTVLQCLRLDRRGQSSMP